MNGNDETDVCWVCGREKGSTEMWLDDADGSGNGACGDCIQDFRVLLSREDEFDGRPYRDAGILFDEDDVDEDGLDDPDDKETWAKRQVMSQAGPRLRLVGGGRGPGGDPGDLPEPNLRLIG